MERLRSGPPIVADGGMGALIAGAVPRLRCPEEANLRAPESVVAVHASYIRAGAELIETNTLGQSPQLAKHVLEDELHGSTRPRVRLAREAREVAGRDVFVAGSIGPLGELEALDPAATGRCTPSRRRCSRIVASICSPSRRSSTSTSSSSRSRRCSRVSSLPIVAMLTFDDEAIARGGIDARTAADRLADWVSPPSGRITAPGPPPPSRRSRR